MKSITIICIIFILFSNCKKTGQNKRESIDLETIAYQSFGAKISSENAINNKVMAAEFSSLKIGDTIDVKFTSTIKEVCSKKGCWMKLSLQNDTQAMVRFKDYGFFMPLDSEGKEVIVNGKAFVKETSVEELQHYAEDAGKSKIEIANITIPKREYTFLADGVLLKK